MHGSIILKNMTKHFLETKFHQYFVVTRFIANRSSIPCHLFIIADSAWLANPPSLHTGNVINQKYSLVSKWHWIPSKWSTQMFWNIDIGWDHQAEPVYKTNIYSTRALFATWIRIWVLCFVDVAETLNLHHLSMFTSYCDAMVQPWAFANI